MKDMQKRLYFILALAGVIILWNLTDVLSTRNIGFSNFLGLLAGLTVAVWVLFAVRWIKKKGNESNDDALRFLQKVDTFDVKKYIWLIRIFLILLWIRVVTQLFFLLTDILGDMLFGNILGVRELVVGILNLFMWLTVAILASIYLKKKLKK